MAKGQLFVAEWGNNCITRLTTTGQYITRFGSYGTAPGQLYRPCSLTIYNNLVYVSDSGNHHVSYLTLKGPIFTLLVMKKVESSLIVYVA